MYIKSEEYKKERSNRLSRKLKQSIVSGFTRATTLPETFQGDSSLVDTRTWLYHGLISGELYVNVCYSAPVSFSIDSAAISEHLSALVFIFFNKLEEGLCPFPRLTCFLLFTSFFSLKFSPFNPSVYQLSQLFFFLLCTLSDLEFKDPIKIQRRNKRSCLRLAGIRYIIGCVRRSYVCLFVCPSSKLNQVLRRSKKPNLRTEQMQRTWQNKKKKDQKRKRKL